MQRSVPGLDGAGLAALGAVFGALLAHLFFKRAPRSCGCISWLETTGTTAGALTWRAIAHSEIGGGAVRRHLRPVHPRANGETL